MIEVLLIKLVKFRLYKKLVNILTKYKKCFELVLKSFILLQITNNQIFILFADKTFLL